MTTRERGAEFGAVLRGGRSALPPSSPAAPLLQPPTAGRARASVFPEAGGGKRLPGGGTQPAGRRAARPAGWARGQRPARRPTWRTSCSARRGPRPRAPRGWGGRGAPASLARSRRLAPARAASLAARPPPPSRARSGPPPPAAASFQYGILAVRMPGTLVEDDYFVGAANSGNDLLRRSRNGSSPLACRALATPSAAPPGLPSAWAHPHPPNTHPHGHTHSGTLTRAHLPLPRPPPRPAPRPLPFGSLRTRSAESSRQGCLRAPICRGIWANSASPRTLCALGLRSPVDEVPELVLYPPEAGLQRREIQSSPPPPRPRPRRPPPRPAPPPAAIKWNLFYGDSDFPWSPREGGRGPRGEVFLGKVPLRGGN